MAGSIKAMGSRMKDICGGGNRAGGGAAGVPRGARAGGPFVARGSGTGLSGGAMPHAGGVLIVMSRMRKILEIDPVSRRAGIEPGGPTLSVSKAAAPFGLFY